MSVGTTRQHRQSSPLVIPTTFVLMTLFLRSEDIARPQRSLKLRSAAAEPTLVPEDLVMATPPHGGYVSSSSAAASVSLACKLRRRLAGLTYHETLVTVGSFPGLLVRDYRTHLVLCAVSPVASGSHSPSTCWCLSRLRDGIVAATNTSKPYGISVLDVEKLLNGLRERLRVMSEAGIEEEKQLCLQLFQDESLTIKDAKLANEAVTTHACLSLEGSGYHTKTLYGLASWPRQSGSTSMFAAAALSGVLVLWDERLRKPVCGYHPRPDGPSFEASMDSGYVSIDHLPQRSWLCGGDCIDGEVHCYDIETRKLVQTFGPELRNTIWWTTHNQKETNLFVARESGHVEVFDPRLGPKQVMTRFFTTHIPMQVMAIQRRPPKGQPVPTAQCCRFEEETAHLLVGFSGGKISTYDPKAGLKLVQDRSLLARDDPTAPIRAIVPAVGSRNYICATKIQGNESGVIKWSTNSSSVDYGLNEERTGLRVQYRTQQNSVCTFVEGGVSSEERAEEAERIRFLETFSETFAVVVHLQLGRRAGLTMSPAFGIQLK